jgi:hypothetical protein
MSTARNSFTVWVKLLNGKRVSVMVQPGDTLDSLKQLIYARAGVPILQQNLMVTGKRLDAAAGPLSLYLNIGIARFLRFALSIHCCVLLHAVSSQATQCTLCPGELFPLACTSSLFFSRSDTAVLRPRFRQSPRSRQPRKNAITPHLSVRSKARKSC